MNGVFLMILGGLLALMCVSDRHLHPRVFTAVGIACSALLFLEGLSAA